MKSPPLSERDVTDERGGDCLRGGLRDGDGRDLGVREGGVVSGEVRFGFGVGGFLGLRSESLGSPMMRSRTSL